MNGQQRQDFEGGYIYYTLGSSQATEVDTPRQPLVTATPGAVRAGSSVHLVIGGFSNGATVRVSQTGQADFLVTTSGGTYTWDSFVPSTASAGTVTVKAADSASSATAQATYTVYTTASSAVTISAVSGNQQNGAPGANLPQPLVVVVKDQNGNPMARPDRDIRGVFRRTGAARFGGDRRKRDGWHGALRCRSRRGSRSRRHPRGGR